MARSDEYFSLSGRRIVLPLKSPSARPPSHSAAKLRSAFREAVERAGDLTPDDRVDVERRLTSVDLQYEAYLHEALSNGHGPSIGFLLGQDRMTRGRHIKRVLERVINELNAIRSDLGLPPV